MTLRTLMQAGPAKANELFARLAETSDGAVKTRERLFAELKTELETHVDLEEQHLYPVLRKHAETKDLVAGAIKDNKELRAKLAELEALPKNDEAFLAKLSELRKAFRQHARDEAKELLPAVQKALSEEQVQGITERMEASLADAEQARHDEEEQRRAAAKQERERAEAQERAEEAAEREREAAARRTREAALRTAAAVRQASDIGAETARRGAEAGAETVQRVGGAAADAVCQGVEDLAERQHEVVQQAAERFQAMSQRVAEAAQSNTENLRALMFLPHSAQRGLQDLQRSVVGLVEGVVRTNLRATQELFQLANPGALIELQQRFAREYLEVLMQGTATLVRATRRAAEETLRPLEQQIEQRRRQQQAANQGEGQRHQHAAE
ncbi:MAG: hemerythrin domain-containing protein [Acetobacteraceae bacterium]|nr:hemerythrin domain-containing protein [Acetobacteraceae bacterium]